MNEVIYIYIYRYNMYVCIYIYIYIYDIWVMEKKMGTILYYRVCASYRGNGT